MILEVMFEDSTETLILVASYTIVLMIILIKLIKCTVQVIKEGGRGVTVEFNGTVIYCSNPDTRKCTAKDMDLIGGILSEHPSNESNSWVCTFCLCDSQGDGEELREMKYCKHIFHRECIDRWCLDTPLCSLKCPLCRGLVFQSQIDPS